MTSLRKIIDFLGNRTLTEQTPLLDYPPDKFRRVYWLTHELSANPKRAELAQALTLDETRPYLGLKGTHGLYASPEWWTNVNRRKIGLRFVSGIIVRVYEGGQDPCGVNNTVDVETADGSRVAVGIFVNNPNDMALFTVGRELRIVYALEVLKRQNRDGSPAYAELPLEMALSVSPAAA